MITIVWFPLSKTILPSVFLTATPSLSESGSVPITISAFVFSANANAMVNASGSSGFGDFTVGKFPSGSACSATIFTSVKPAFAKTLGIDLIEVPCNDV